MSDAPRPLQYASPPMPPLRDGYGMIPVFFAGWGIGFAVLFVCSFFMCGGEIWSPYVAAFPHAAVAIELFEPPTSGPGNSAALPVLLASPITHGIYAVILKLRSRLGLTIAVALHIICLVWSFLLPDPFLA